MASAAAVPAAHAGPPLTLEQQDAESGNYRAASKYRIVCVGDLEGTSLEKLIDPTGANSVRQTNVLTPTVSKLTELYEYLTVSPDGTLRLKENVILVYLGDVFGDGPDNIKLATTLLKLKKDNPTRVILITGNRDLILERLPYELQPTDTCMAELMTRVGNFLRREPNPFNGFTFVFKRNNPDDFDYMWDFHPTNISEKKGCLERVIYVKGSSMTEHYGWVFLVDEYLTKKKFTPKEISDISLETKSYIYVFLVQAMAMSGAGAIDCGVPEFNGIFERLLMNGHLIACIDAGTRGKFGFMHSLPPRRKIPTIPGAIYKEQYEAAKDLPAEQQKTDIVGKVKDNDITSAKKVEINVGLREFNQSFRELIQTHRTSDKNWRELLECVSGMTSGSYWGYQNNTKTGANMPFATVSFGTGFNKYEFASGNIIQDGGTILHLKDSIATQFIDTNDFTDIIFSHSPKGYVGVKVKTTNGKTYYCIDVSKIDDQEYDVKERFGCCFLILDLSKLGGGVNDQFIGRIMLKQSQFPKDYNIFTGETVEGAVFAGGHPMYANYVISPIPISSKKDMEQTLNLTMKDHLQKDLKYVFKYVVGVSQEKRNFNRFPDPTTPRLLDYYTKMPTLELVSYGGGSRTRKRRSRYLKKSARTTHKRRISKKLAQKNNRRKDKKSKRSSTAR